MPDEAGGVAIIVVIYNGRFPVEAFYSQRFTVTARKQVSIGNQNSILLSVLLLVGTRYKINSLLSTSPA